jgi:hypothetical protein
MAIFFAVARRPSATDLAAHSTMTHLPHKAAGQIQRRVYTAVAVGLAFFLVTITAVGIVCRGYEISTPTAHAEPPKNIAADTHDHSVVADRKTEDQIHSYVESASKEFVNAETALADFVTAHFKELVESAPRGGFQANSKGTQNVSSSNPPPSPSTSLGHRESPPPAMVVNPQWQELHDQLKKLERRRTESLESFLPAHPAIQALNSSIKALESQLSAIPKEVIAPTKVDGGSLPIDQPPQTIAIPAPSDSPTLSDPAVQWRAAETEFKKLAERAESAQQKYREAVEKENAALKSGKSSLEVPVIVINVPKPVARANPKKSIIWCGIASLAIGIFVALNARKSEAVFHTAAEVRQRLGLTILGLLPLAAGQSPRERPVSEPRWIGRIVAASELSLVAVVAILVVAAATDRHFFHALLANPLSACSQKWWC